MNVTTNTLEIMPDIEYVAHNGMKCPVCRSFDVLTDINTLQMDSKVASREARCEHCLNSWSETFKLVFNSLTAHERMNVEDGMCPRCLDDDIDDESCDMPGAWVDQTFRCNSCRFTWDMEYRLESYDLILNKANIKEKN
jgi:transposase-like protein